MTFGFHSFLLCLAITCLAMAGCRAQRLETSKMQSPITADVVIQFLNRFEELAEKEDFALIRHLISRKRILSLQ